MNPPRVLIALCVFLLSVGWLIWHRAHKLSPIPETTISPTPETESAFLKNYTPTNVLNRFNDGQASYGHGGTAGAGHDFATHTADFDGDFALCSEKFVPLMDALSDDVAAQLVGKGGRVLNQIGDARAGFHFDYKLGQTVGSVTISRLELTPLDPTSVLGHSKPVPNCMACVHTSIQVAEKWFPKERGLTHVTVNNSIQ